MSFRNGDMVKCEYIRGEFAKGRIVAIEGKKAKVEIAITSRRSKTIYKDIIEIELSKIEPIIKVG